MSQQARLLGYCLAVGLLGWAWVLAALWQQPPALIPVLLWIALAALAEALAFRLPPDDPQSLVGLVLVAAALTHGPVTGALVAAIEGLGIGVALPLWHRQPRTAYALVGRPALRSGARALAILLGGSLAGLLAQPSPDWLLLITTIACYSAVLFANRAGREYLAGGPSGLSTWWESSWRSSLLNELLPLPLAALFAAIVETLPWPYLVLAAIALLGAAYAIQRSSIVLLRQRRNVRELALLNESSRAIIRAELNVEQLCELIYQQASKVVDTSSFHLGLFGGDSYTLMVWVQDRVRKPALTVELPEGDGIVGWMRQTRRSLLVRDFETEMERLPARPRYQSEHPPRSGIYMPLIAGETVIGSISIQSYRANAFDAEDLRILALIADQAAIAIARAQAFAEANTRANQLQLIREVSEKVTAILNLDQLLPAVVRLIRERFGYHPVHIFTVDGDAVVFRASSAAENLPVATLRRLRIGMGQGVVGHVAQSGEPLLVPDVRQEPLALRDERGTRSELAVPLRIGERVVGVLDVQSNQVDDFNQSDLFVIRTLADQVAIAIDSANLYTLEQEEAWTLNSLLQASENLARRAGFDDLLATIVRLPSLLIGCDRCAFLRWQDDTRSFLTLASYGYTESERELLRRSISEVDAPLLATMRQSGQPAMLEVAASNPHELPPFTNALGSYSLLALPLIARGALLGALVIEHAHEPHSFSRRQLAMYIGFANQAAAAVESALLAQEAATAGRLEQELRVAREIQTTLLPQQPPHAPGYQLAAAWRSARIVGGDFYDFWWLPGQGFGERRRETADRGPASELLATSYEAGARDLGFVIADVSDKGVPAALFMALARSLVRAAALDGSEPFQALVRANRWISRDSESGMFVTLFYGVLDTTNGALRYTCAGHNPPLHYHAASRSFSALRTPGMALGVLEEISLGQATTMLQPGDLLVCYTDGVTEAINADEEPFDVDRLKEAIVASQADGAEAVVEGIIAAQMAFCGNQPPFDDVTLLVIQRLEQSPAEAVP
jgi:serine phosphatase RsbU (regulator of sigma subunit)/putative methionine-R-sulfoxide reductase with GAF domain